MTSPDEKNAAQQPSTATVRSEPSQEDLRQGGTAVAAPTPSFDSLNELILIFQWWLDFNASENADADDDTKIMRPPEWPSRGVIKEWIKALKAKQSELAAERAKLRNWPCTAIENGEVGNPCVFLKEAMAELKVTKSRADKYYDLLLKHNQENAVALAAAKDELSAPHRRLDDAAKELPKEPNSFKVPTIMGELPLAVWKSDYDTLRQQLADVIVKHNETRSDKDGAYFERNNLVAAIARLYPSGIRSTSIEGWDAEWHGCVYIDLPSGQISYHYHDSHAHLFADLPPYEKPWDGHDKDTVHKRLADVSR